MSRIKTLRIQDFIYNNVKLIDVFQKLNSDYLFLKVNQSILPEVFNIYQESSYELQCVIPWLKIPFEEVTIIELTSKYRDVVDYLMVYQKPQTKSIKSRLKTIIIEQDLVTTMNHWEKDLIINLCQQGFTGIYVTSDGYIDSASNIMKLKHGDSKVKLF